jgi:multiple sugar transport system substrate-binding protein
VKRSLFLAIALMIALVISSFATVTIVMTAGAVGAELQVLQTQIKEFMQQNPGIKVVLMPMPNSTTDRYNLDVTYLSAQMPEPDILFLDTIDPPAFADFLVNLKPYFTDQELSQFFKGAIDNDTYNGRLVAIPWFVDAGILYYRADLLQKYGFQPPTTWDQLIQEAQYISQKENIQGFVWQGAAYEGLTCDFMEYVHSYGGNILDENGKVVSDSPQVKTALQTMYDMIYKYKISPVGVTTYQEEDARHIFQNGDAVFMRNWPYCWPLLQATDSAVRGKVGVEVLPEGTGFPGVHHSATLGGWELAINKYSEHIPEAVKLIKFLTSPQQEAYKAINAGQAPSVLSVYNDPAVIQAVPLFKSLYDVFMNAEPRPKSPIYAQISQIIYDNVNAALTKQETVDQAIANMTAQLKQLLGQ